MYKHTRRKSSILAIVIVATTALSLLAYTSLTYSALAAKSGSSDKRGFKYFAACELNAANAHSGQLTVTGVMDCYSQAFSDNSISSMSVTGHNADSTNKDVNGNMNDTNTVPTNLSHLASSGPDTTHHHSSPSSSTDSMMKSNIRQ